MLSKSQILTILKKNNVNMGKNPNRNFNYLLEKGLIPEGIIDHNDKRKMLYPDYTVKQIEYVRKNSKVGRSLKEIKVSLSFDPGGVKLNLLENKNISGEIIKVEEDEK